MSSTLSGFDTDLRKATDQSLEQVRSAIRSYIQFLQRAVPETVLGGPELSNKVLGYAEHNVANAFEFGQRLLQVRDVQALVQLQMEFIQKQTQTITEQAHDLQEITTKMVFENIKSSFLCA